MNANYIRDIETTFAPGARPSDVVGTVGNPAGWRVKANATVSRKLWEAALATNLTGGYTDPTSTVQRSVDSYFTVDTYIRYTLPMTNAAHLDGLSITLSAANLLKARPPYISGSLATRDANYDAVNADPMGRLISIEISKAW